MISTSSPADALLVATPSTTIAVTRDSLCVFVYPTNSVAPETSAIFLYSLRSV